MSNNPANVQMTPRRAAGANDDHWKKYYIYKIPAYKKAQNLGAYSPQLVSIGPYNHGKADLQAMEEHKARALQRFIGGGSSINNCCQALESKFDELNSSYQSLSEEFKGSGQAIKNKFLMLMVKDGVFLYEFMRGYPNGEGWEYDEQDPVFSVRALRNIPNLVGDILMLENQLPLIVLERLIAVEKKQPGVTHYEEVNKLVLKFLSQNPPYISDMSQPLGLHVLDISRKVITRKFEPPGNQPNETDTAVKSANNLYDVGVKFKKNENISFEKPTLNLLPLTFDTNFEPRLLNAIAFECLHPATNHEVSSYIAFMQGLIASPSDVAFLRSEDLIESKIGDDQAVDKLMRRISKDVLFNPSSDLCKVRDCLNKYHKDNMGNCRRRCREWKRALHQNYFKNPWTITAWVVALFILVLTLLQTIYSIMSYKLSLKSAQ